MSLYNIFDGITYILMSPRYYVLYFRLCMMLINTFFSSMSKYLHDHDYYRFDFANATLEYWLEFLCASG